MSSTARLQRDFSQLARRVPCASEFFVVHGLHQDRIREWEVFLLAPPGTVYHPGVFKALLRFPEAFPMEPPSVTFLSPIWHPNVYRDGKVCLSVIQVPPPSCPAERLAEFWRPVLGVEQVLLSVIALLSSPEPGDPANAAAAAQFLNDKSAFEAQVKEVVTQSLRLLPSDFVRPVLAAPSRVVEVIEPATKRYSQVTATATHDAEEGEEDEEEYRYEDDDYAAALSSSQGTV